MAVVLLVTPATPQQQGMAAGLSAGLMNEVSGVNQSLKDLVVLLQQHLGDNETELIMKRIELKASQLAPLEDDLRQARSSLSSMETETAQMKMILEQVERRMEDHQAGGTQEDHRMFEELTLQMKVIEDRRWSLEQKALDYEQDLKEGRERIEAWEELVDTRLNLR